MQQYCYKVLSVGSVCVCVRVCVFRCLLCSVVIVTLHVLPVDTAGLDNKDLYKSDERRSSADTTSSGKGRLLFQILILLSLIRFSYTPENAQYN